MLLNFMLFRRFRSTKSEISQPGRNYCQRCHAYLQNVLQLQNQLKEKTKKISVTGKCKNKMGKCTKHSYRRFATVYNFLSWTHLIHTRTSHIHAPSSFITCTHLIHTHNNTFNVFMNHYQYRSPNGKPPFSKRSQARADNESDGR